MSPEGLTCMELLDDLYNAEWSPTDAGEGYGAQAEIHGCKVTLPYVPYQAHLRNVAKEELNFRTTDFAQVTDGEHVLAVDVVPGEGFTSLGGGSDTVFEAVAHRLSLLLTA